MLVIRWNIMLDKKFVQESYQSRLVGGRGGRLSKSVVSTHSPNPVVCHRKQLFVMEISLLDMSECDR